MFSLPRWCSESMKKSQSSLAPQTRSCTESMEHEVTRHPLGHVLPESLLRQGGQTPSLHETLVTGEWTTSQKRAVQNERTLVYKWQWNRCQNFLTC